MLDVDGQEVDGLGVVGVVRLELERHRVGLVALVGVVEYRAHEHRPDEFAARRAVALEIGQLDVAARVEQVEDIGVGSVPERAQQRGGRELLPLVDVDVDHVVGCRG
jgi:hypothetical protein